MTENHKIYVGFGDIIYALIIGSSFEVLKTSFLPLQISFATFTIFLAYATIVQSWIGYHRVIESHSYKNSFRFLVDLIVWFLFFILVFSVNNFADYIKIYPAILFFLMLWRYGVIREDFIREGWIKTLKAMLVVIIHVASSVAIVLSYELITPIIDPGMTLIFNSVILAMMYIEIFLYYQLRRFDKIGKYLKDKPVPISGK
ncbi:MAG: hypothetical protein QXJ74_05460 [Nitrososphaera sp.]